MNNLQLQVDRFARKQLQQPQPDDGDDDDDDDDGYDDDDVGGGYDNDDDDARQQSDYGYDPFVSTNSYKKCLSYLNNNGVDFHSRGDDDDDDDDEDDDGDVDDEVAENVYWNQYN